MCQILFLHQMQFHNPTFLWALLALLIPIIIHLFHFRRYKKVYFSNVKMLQEIKDEKSMSNRLKHLLVLASRLLAMAAIILAFAQPYIPSGEKIKKGNSAVSIFVDNSFSMENRKDEIPLLDIAKEKARQIVKAYTQQDRFQILTQEMYGKSQRLLSQEEALNAIDNVIISPASKDFDQIINRQKQAIQDKEENTVSYILSDFPTHYINNNIVKDTSMSINMLKINSVGSINVGIDTAYLDAPVTIPNEVNKVIVQLKNYSTQSAEGIRLSSIIDGIEKPEGIFDIPAGASVKDTVFVNLGIKNKTEIVLKTQDYPISFDNNYYLCIDNPKTINILSIYDQNPNRYVSALVDGIQLFNHYKQSINKVDYNSFNKQNLIILEDLPSISSGLISSLKTYVQQGGNVLIFPSANAVKANYSTLSNALKIDRLSAFEESQRTVSKLNTEEFIFENVFEKINKNTTLPTTKGNYNIFKKNGQNLLTYRDGKPFLRKSQNVGYTYLCAAPLNNKYSNLAFRAEIFVPMIFKIAINKGNRMPNSFTIGENNSISLPISDRPESVYEIKGNKDFIPAQKDVNNQTLLKIINEIEEAGFYDINEGNKKIDQLAFNYNRKESLQKTTNEQQMTQLAKKIGAKIISAEVKDDFSQYIKRKQQGIPLWKWLVIAALLFLLIEILLIKYWRK